MAARHLAPAQPQWEKYLLPGTAFFMLSEPQLLHLMQRSDIPVGCPALYAFPKVLCYNIGGKHFCSVRVRSNEYQLSKYQV